MQPHDLRERTMRFALEAAMVCRSIQHDWQGRRLADQMFRSATSVAANYHAACRARSHREFIAKLGIVTEEAHETLFWLDFAARSRLLQPESAEPLKREARELLAIFISSAKTAAANSPDRRYPS
ncbi:MAG: four helix bundle protein [Vicinamibacterales bacterium]